MDDYFSITISGGRTFDEFWEFVHTLDDILLPNATRKFIRIHEGGAKGVDAFAYRWAAMRKMKCRRYEAYWDDFGKRAGILRNISMIDDSDMVIAFWDGESKGTHHAIAHALKTRKRLIIVRYDMRYKIIEIQPNKDGFVCEAIPEDYDRTGWLALRQILGDLIDVEEDVSAKLFEFKPKEEQPYVKSEKARNRNGRGVHREDIPQVA